jgi:hypothetical protein
MRVRAGVGREPGKGDGGVGYSDMLTVPATCYPLSADMLEVCGVAVGSPLDPMALVCAAAGDVVLTALLVDQECGVGPSLDGLTRTWRCIL